MRPLEPRDHVVPGGHVTPLRVHPRAVVADVVQSRLLLVTAPDAVRCVELERESKEHSVALSDRLPGVRVELLVQQLALEKPKLDF